MIFNSSKIKYISLVFALFLFSFFSIPVYADSKNPIEKIELTDMGDVFPCIHLKENVYVSDGDTDCSFGDFRVYVTDSERYKVTSASSSFDNNMEISLNTKISNVWEVNSIDFGPDYQSCGAQVFYFDIQDTQTQNTESYILVVKNEDTLGRDRACVTNPGAELLDSSKNSLEEARIDAVESVPQVKEVDDFKESKVYLRFTRPHEEYTVFTSNTLPKWMLPENNFFRINGSEKVQFNSSDTGKNDIVSAPIYLKKGINVIEAYSDTNNNPYLGELKVFGSDDNGYELGKFYAETGMIDEFVWIINYTGEENQPVLSDNNEIKDIHAFNYVYKYLDNPADYATKVDAEKNEYSIDLPENMKYPYILLQIRTKDEASKVTLPENMVKSLYGSIYSIEVSPGETKEIPVTVTAENGNTKVHNIKLNWLSSKCNIEDISIENGKLEGSLNAEDTSYYVETVGNGDIVYKLKISEGAKASLNGKEGTKEGDFCLFTAKASDPYTNILVTAYDGTNKKLYTFVNKTLGNYFGVSETTKTKAKELLNKTDWYSTESNIAQNGYWDVLKRAAAGLSFDNTKIYDITKMSVNFFEPQTYGLAILELVLAGENPYNFNDTNYVVLLEKYGEKYENKSFGSNESDVWAYIGLKAAGAQNDYPYMNDLLNRVKFFAMNSSGDIELRSLAWAALGDELSEKQKIYLVEEVRDKYLSDKDDMAGIFTYYDNISYVTSSFHVAVMEGLNALDYDVEKYQFDESHSPLNTLKSLFYSEGEWLNKVGGYADEDKVIISLCDIVNGGSIYNKYAPTKEELNKLVEIATPLLETASKTGQEKLKAAYDEAVKVKDLESGFGKEYYSLYSAIAAIDPSKVSKPNARMCSDADSEKVDAVIELINNLKEEYTLEDLQNKEAYDEALEAYNSLDKIYYKSYVTNIEKLYKTADIYEDLATAKEVSDMINELPEKVSLENKEAVENVQKAYEELGELNKYISGDTLEKYNNALMIIKTALLAEKIGKLPEADKITLNDKEAVENLIKEINALSEDELAYLKENYTDSIKKLEDAEAAIKKLQEAENAVKKGDKILVGSLRYQVTNVSTKNATVKFIGAKTTALTNITIPATIKYKNKTFKVTEIADASCKNYGKLKSIVIGTNVTTIGKNAFYACKNLTLIEVKATALKKVGEGALKGINKNAVIKVPSKKLQAYKTLFNNKGQNNTVSVRGDGEVLIGQYYYKVTNTIIK
ncbi:Leucine rich repeat-containing protein [Acetitomaculum ruminis DSM 5522]|uniref:Leucine rich repeat-containing protein n=1 Tax=Acetitomaculum ruminis DSM 5522 TaxID=1120918 RepID=A0A1I1AH71_9FIRM|nr:leucine-rich repeat protein [Acetitomaculum ruminis]SFB37354.1 Leucine rich repeat-containing protein [Acetitomaculum ruminis DSM 5522]